MNNIYIYPIKSIGYDVFKKVKIRFMNSEAETEPLLYEMINYFNKTKKYYNNIFFDWDDVYIRSRTEITTINFSLIEKEYLDKVPLSFVLNNLFYYLTTSPQWRPMFFLYPQIKLNKIAELISNNEKINRLINELSKMDLYDYHEYFTIDSTDNIYQEHYLLNTETEKDLITCLSFIEWDDKQNNNYNFLGIKPKERNNYKIAIKKNL